MRSVLDFGPSDWNSRSYVLDIRITVFGALLVDKTRLLSISICTFNTLLLLTEYGVHRRQYLTDSQLG